MTDSSRFSLPAENKKTLWGQLMPPELLELLEIKAEQLSVSPIYVQEFLRGNHGVYMSLKLRTRPNVIYTVKAI